ncbi:TetR/AcrR family transcriptional regulator [Leucobacter sp. W1153]|uniref:TetR/AcrR family transcriptional regulator n=1 Tax=Leucobacter sp. W1153 TaxID=3439064 RepID=UPI003F329BE9
MGMQQPRGVESAAVSAAAIRLLSERGYESTTAGDLADAAGISRSTFFRRFGSKDDIIFVDHDLALQRLTRELANSAAPSPEAIGRATVGVLQLLTRDTDAAQLRSELLRQNPALRERELIISHRYERVFAEYLTGVATPDTPSWAPFALAASVVAVHNAALRRWLRDPDPRIVVGLDPELRQLVGLYSPWFGGSEAPASRVIVTAFDSATSAEEVVNALRRSLETPVG